jgi:hypothetical protein
MCKKSLLMMLLLTLLVPWAANAQETLTVHDGTATNSYVPIYGYYADAYLKCEMVYPAAELEDMADGTITSLTFYATTPAAEAWTGTWQVSVTEIDTTAISAFAGPGTVVYEGALDGTQSTMVIPFSTPYTYNGGNLLVCVYETAKGNYKSVTWAGETVEGASVQGYSYTSLAAVSPTQRNFLPKTTFGYLPEGSVFVPAPSDLSVTLTPGNGTVATLAWTENGTATQWQICLNGDETNLIAATTNPWPLTGLTPETAYTAKVRATTADGESDWSNEVTFTPTNAYVLTVNDGTTTNGYVPIYGTWVDAITKSQFIIPAENLTDMAWGTINKMTFYGTNTGSNPTWGAAQFEVYMTETSDTTLSALADYGTMTKVMNSAHLQIDGNQMVVEFDTPYSYMGGNLMIGFLQTVSGSYSGCTWYGVSATGASMGGYGSSISQQNFLPKTTFGYIPGEEPECMWPTNLIVDNVGPHSATLSWTSDGTTWNIGITAAGGTEQYVEVTENPYTLTGLDPETDYAVRVQKKCDETTYSIFSEFAYFTTEVACPAPTNFVVSDITAFSANVSWNALSNVTLRYVANPNFFFQGFVTDAGAMADGADASWIKGASTTWGPSGNYAGGYYLADDFTVNTATSLTEIEVYGYQTGSTTESTFTGLYAMILSGNPMEGTVDTIWGDMTTNLMTSTSFTNCYRGSDGQTTATTRPIMAVTASGLNINLAAGTYWLVYGMTGTLSSGPWAVPYSDPVVGNIGDGLQYSSSGWAALTDSGSGAYGPAMKLSFGDIESFDWTTVNNISTGEYAMTNLDPETLYLVQVRANCGSEGNSNWVSTTFTTLPSCLFPTDLVVSDIEARQAVLAWTENGDATAWEVEVVGNTTTVLNATQNPYTLTGLNPETRYTVRVRSKCSNTDFSEWSLGTSFTTAVACPAPTNLAFADITRISANVSWDGEADSYEMEYATGGASYLTYDFEDGTLQGWTNLIVNAEGGQWIHSNDNGGGYDYTGLAHSGTGFATCYSYVDGGSGAFDTDAYLVSPNSYQIGGNASLNFWYDFANDTYPEYTEVCIATVANPTASDFTVIWNTGSAKGSNGLREANANRQRNTRYDNWREVTLDLSAYAGQSIWIAFHDVNYDAYEIWIDDITVNAGGELVWTPVGTVTSPYLFNNLDPETTYMVRVRANCGEEDGYSAWLQGSFTTEEACPAPYALGATPYALSAELSWEGISESYTVRYGITEVGETLSSFDFENETIPADFTNSTSYPWTVTEGGADGSGYCVIPGNAGQNSTTSDLTLQLTGPCAVSFMAKVSSENNYDWGRFLIDGTQQMQISDTQDWTAYNYTVTEGTHTLVWRYYKDSSTSSNDDLFYVDNIVINEIGYDWNITTATTNECVITGLEPATTYYVQVMGDCGDFGTSEWSEMISFTTTEDACPVPTNLTVNNETLTATTADLSWEGSPDVESFTVRYRTPEYVVGGLSETFDNTSVPAGWMKYSGLVDDVVAGTATLSSTSSGWLFDNTNVFGQYHAKVNIFGTSCKYWLVTPEVTPSNGTFTFDLALTDYANADPIEDTTAQADDRFVVLVYANEAWTILREWNNSGSDYVYNNIATEGEAVSIDLSAYVGQAVKIAFYGESTIGSNGDNDLHIDNVVIGNPQTIPATDWQTVTTSDMNVTLTGLTPETTYEAQVKADCSDPEAWSNTVNFTTLEQTTLTQTIALSAGATYVSFYVDITLNELKNALVEVSPNTTIKITGKNSATTYDPQRHRWSGNLQWNVAQMYIIRVAADCEVSLEGMPIDPAEHPVTIVSGSNYIAFPFAENMSLTNAFDGFAVNGDKVLSKNGSATYNRGRWQGSSLSNLEPGKGYIYKSSTTESRTLVFPLNAK